MDLAPIRVLIPATLQTPAMILEGPVVKHLPYEANLGDMVTCNDRLMVYCGDHMWADYHFAEFRVEALNPY